MTKPPAKKGARSPTKRKTGADLQPGKATGRRGAKGTRGQPSFEPTKPQQDMVSALVSIGTTHKAIAKLLNIPLRTLERHFQPEMADGKEQIHARIGGAIAAGALNGDRTLMIFYAKAQMGWRDRVAMGFEDSSGKIVNPQNLFAVRIE